MEAQQHILTLKLCLVAALAFFAFTWSSSDQVTAAGTGNSITSPDLSGDMGHDTSLALDSAGNPVVSYNGGDKLKIMHCNDPDCAGGDESITVPVTGDQVAESGTAIVLDAAGNPVVAYARYGLFLLHCDDPDCDGLGESITTLAGGGSAPAIALDPTGNPVIAYSRGGDLKLLHCDDPNCDGIGESITTPDFLGITGIAPDIALDGAGNPVISHSSVLGLRLLHCDDPNCDGAGDSQVTMDASIHPDGTDSSLELDGAGNPVIAYHQTVSEAIGIVHCGNPNCTAGNIFTTFDEGLDREIVLSMSLDADGSPVVSYADTSFDGLKVLRCDDPNCEGNGETMTVVDPTNQNGRWHSLALDQAGYPVISYDGTTDRDLKLLHCGTSNCLGDSDKDGCNDQQEAGSDEMLGGLRDLDNPWDFYDTNGDQIVDLSNDILGVILHYAPSGQEAEYEVNYDRGPSEGPNPWNMTAPDGVIDLSNDILGVIHQYLHDCR